MSTPDPSGEDYLARQQDMRRWAVSVADEATKLAGHGEIDPAIIHRARDRVVVRDAAAILRVHDHRLAAWLLERFSRSL